MELSKPESSRDSESLERGFQDLTVSAKVSRDFDSPCGDVGLRHDVDV